MTLSREDKDRIYSRLQIVRIDGTKIEGHDAVKEFFEKEEKMLRTHGPTLTFEIFRMDLQANNVKDLQGPMLAELKLNSNFVSGVDTVESVKNKIHALLTKENAAPDSQESKDALRLEDGDRISLYFNYRPMKTGALFYADHFIMLPAWIQVLIHRCEPDELQQLIYKLNDE